MEPILYTMLLLFAAMMVGLFLFSYYWSLPWQFYLRPWIRKAEPEDFTGLRYFQKLQWFYVVLDPEVFKPVWLRYNLMLFASIIATLGFILYWAFNTADEAAGPGSGSDETCCGLSLGLVLVGIVFAATAWAIQTLERYYDEGRFKQE